MVLATLCILVNEDIVIDLMCCSLKMYLFDFGMWGQRWPMNSDENLLVCCTLTKITKLVLLFPSASGMYQLNPLSMGLLF